MTITPKQKGGEVHIYTSAGPTILVEGGRCKLNNIKLSFFSHNFLKPKKETLVPLNNTIIQQSPESPPEEKLDSYSKYKYAKRYASQEADVDSLHCAVLQKGGNLLLENCQISMMFATDEKLEFAYSAIVILEGTTLKISKCEIKSQRMPLLTGVTAIGADITIVESRIYDNFAGGVYLISNERNIVQVASCSICRNKSAGIYVEGNCQKLLIRKYGFKLFRI